MSSGLAFLRAAVDEAERDYKRSLMSFHSATNAAARAVALAKCRGTYATLEVAYRAVADASPNHEEPK